jgi:hypothetical protein
VKIFEDKTPEFLYALIIVTHNGRSLKQHAKYLYSAWRGTAEHNNNPKLPKTASRISTSKVNTNPKRRGKAT